MSNKNFFNAFSRDIPVGISNNDLRALAEEIAEKEGLFVHDVEQNLRDAQTLVATKVNADRRVLNGRCSSFVRI